MTMRVQRRWGGQQCQYFGPVFRPFSTIYCARRGKELANEEHSCKWVLKRRSCDSSLINRGQWVRPLLLSVAPDILATLWEKTPLGGRGRKGLNFEEGGKLL